MARSGPWIFVSLFGWTLVACGASTDQILVGPRFWLGPDQEAVALRVDAKGRFVSAHAQYPTDGELVNVPGRIAYPGLGDAHVHLSWIARRADVLDLAGLKSAADVRAALEGHAKQHPERRTLTGDSWDQTLWTPPELPTAADLGADVKVPAVLSRVDGHAIWLNRAALELAGPYLARDHAPPERIIRGADGRASGVVVDPHPELMALLVPAPARADLERWIDRGMEQCADAGLVEVHDMATSPAELEVLMERAKSGPLPVRVVVYLDDSEASYAWMAKHGPKVVGDLEVRGVKLFADGALGSRGAALKAPYHDDAAHAGQATPIADLQAKAVRAATLGFDVAIHAIGDLGTANALTALEAAVAANVKVRGRVEHAQVVDVAHDLARFQAHGFVASMQPTHATSDMRWAEQRLGAERTSGAYAWKTMLRAKVPLAFGSDAPIETYDPRYAIWAATRRQTPKGEPPGGWFMAEAVTFAEAIEALSAGVAYAAHAEATRGRLEKGRLVQLSVFDRALEPDPLAAQPMGTVRGRVIRATGEPTRRGSSRSNDRP